jgi:flagellar basal body-associated protein FliL
MRQDKIQEALDLIRKIQENKKDYETLDALISEFRAEGFQEVETELGKLRLKDNFQETNTVFRPAGVERFELVIEKPKREKRT